MNEHRMIGQPAPVEVWLEPAETKTSTAGVVAKVIE